MQPEGEGINKNNRLFKHQHVQWRHNLFGYKALAELNISKLLPVSFCH